ncbi:MAG: hypothetical protein IPN05_20350 [Sulfuritalea sp.]|nr:hypothetical protein [Sulfuritalea sp.]
MPRGVKPPAGRRLRGRMAFVLSARILDPQFQEGRNQGKAQLAQKQSSWVPAWCAPSGSGSTNIVETGKAIAEVSIKQALARQKNAQKVEKRKQSGVAVLPGKLSDCESTDLAENELFLVEGDSMVAPPRWRAQQGNPGHLPLRVCKGAQFVSRTRAAVRQCRDPRHRGRALGIDPHRRTIRTCRPSLRQADHHVRRRRRRLRTSEPCC